MRSKTLKIKPLVLYYDDPDKKLQDILDENPLVMSKEIINKVCYAIDNELETILIAEIRNPIEKLSIICKRDYYLETLNTNLKRLIEAEEYKICAKAKKYI